MAAAEYQIILKNNSGAAVLVQDLGLEIANLESMSAHLQYQYQELAGSDSLKTLITAGTLVVNDGTADLSVVLAIKHLTRASKKYVDELVGAIDISASLAPLQAELDAIEAGAGLGAGGAFTADPSTTFLKTASSIVDATKKLDTQAKANADAITAANTATAAVNTKANNIQSELDVTQGGAGLNSDGTFSAAVGNRYTGSSVSLKDATNDLDAALAQVADDLAALGAGSITDLQSELDMTQAGAGLGSNGAYTADASTNYAKTATSLKGSVKMVDAQVKVNADAIASLETQLATDEGVIAQQALDISSANTAIGINSTAIGTEVSNRTAADTALQNELDATQGGAGLAANGTYVPDPSTNFLQAATSLKDGEHKLDAQAKANADAIAAETTARTNADALKFDKAGGTMTGNVDMGIHEIFTSSFPSSDDALVNKGYVAAQLQGIAPKASVRVAQEPDLDAVYTNGTGGVGAKLTASAVGAFPAVDGITLVLNDELLVYHQSPNGEGGVYVLTTVGNGATKWVLTRRSDLDGAPSNELMPGTRITVREGLTWAGYEFTLMGTAGVGLIPGTDAIEWDAVPGNMATAMLQAELDAVEAAVGLSSDGSFSGYTGTEYLNAVTSQKGADIALDTALKANHDADVVLAARVTVTEGNVVTLQTEVAEMQAGSLANIAVLNNVLFSRDIVRGKWIGPRLPFTFARKGLTRNQFLEMPGGLASNNSGIRVAVPSTITTLAVQLDSVAAADSVFQIRKNDDPTVIGSLTVSAGQTGAQKDDLNIDLAPGEFLQAFCSCATAVEDPVMVITVAYNGGTV